MNAVTLSHRIHVDVTPILLPICRAERTVEKGCELHASTRLAQKAQQTMIAAGSLSDLPVCKRLLGSVRFTLMAFVTMLLLCPARAALGQAATFAGVQTTVYTGISPQYVTFDKAGNGYIADNGSGNVLKLPPGCASSSCQVKVYSGGEDPEGIAVDAAGNLFIALYEAHKVIELPPGCTTASCSTTVISGLNDGVQSLALDAAGDLYVTYYVPGSSKLLEVPAGCTSAACGVNISSGLNSPSGLAVDPSGNLFVTDVGTGQIVEFPAGCTGGGCQSVAVTGFTNPLGVAVDASGNVFVADSYQSYITKVPVGCTNESCGIPIGAGSNLYAPNAVALDPAGDVLIGDPDTNEAVEIDVESANFGPVNTCPAGQTTPAPCSQTETLNYNISGSGTLGLPVAVTQGAPNLDFSVVSNTCAGAQTAGTQCTVTVTFSPKYPGARNGAVELVDANGNVLTTTYVHGIGQGPQIAFSSGTRTIVPTSGLTNPTGLAFDGAGDLFIVDSNNNQVVKLTPAGTQTTVVSGLNGPQGIAVDGAGNVFIADENSSRVVEEPAAGGALITVGNNLRAPNGVAVDGAGNIFIADTNNNRIVEILAASGTQVAAGSGISGPIDVVVDGSGNLFVSSIDLPYLVELPAGGGPQISLGSGFSQPFSLAVDGAGNIYVADRVHGRIVELPAGGSSQITVSSIGGSSPEGIALDAAGDLFIDDSYAATVSELNRSQAPGFSFASTEVGQTSTDSPQSTQIQNIGNQALNAIPPGLAVGMNFAQLAGNGSYTDCTPSFSLAPGALCNLSIAFTPQQVGSIQSSAVLTDNSLNNTTPAAQQTIALSGTATVLQDTITFNYPTSGLSYAYGQSFYASVTASDLATASVYSSSTPTAIVNQNGYVTIIGVGPVTINASQPATGNYAAGSGSVSFNAVQAATTTTLSGAINPTPGNTATLTATVAPKNPGTYGVQPSGMVTFYNAAGASIGSATITAGTATLITPAYSGSQSFTATYTGGGNYLASAPSNTVPLTFSVAPTITFTTASSYAYGQSFQLMATSNSLGGFTYKLINGPATVSSSGMVTVTGEGMVTVEADEAAATGYNAGSSQATFNAVKAATTTMLSGTINATPANTATLTATVSPQNPGTYPAQPSGTVTFYNSTGGAISTVNVVSGKATLTTATYTGMQSFTAVYNGDTNYTASPASNSVPLTFTVAPTITFTTAASYAYGQSFQLAASSNSAGTFTYSLVNGPAAVTPAGAVTVTGEGKVTVQASEAAAPGYNAGAAQTSFIAVQASTTTKLTATAVKSGYGSAASLTATVLPQYSGVPSSSVTFYDGSTKLATVTISGGTASYTTGQLVGAQHSYSATYSGDTNFLGSTSNTVALTIPVTAVSLQLASTNLVYPLPPAFEILVSPASGKPAPTGTVTIYDGSTAIGSYPLYSLTKGYLIGLVLPPLNVGTHPLTAVYSGDANYAPGTSATVIVTVSPGPVKLSLSCQNTKLKLGQTHLPAPSTPTRDRSL
jgi:sugar lactone lactonase YvrE